MPKPSGRTSRPAAPPASPVPADRDTEQRILDAAHAEFTRHGTAGARMQDIADEAGVNKALVHYYFRTKDRLAEAVFQRAAGRLFPAVIAVLASDADLTDKVHRVVAHYLDHLAHAPFLAGYVLSELNQHPDRITQFVQAMTSESGADLPRARDVLQRQLRAGARDGSLRPIAVEQFLVNLLALCVFPFAARPLIGAALGMDDARFQRFISQRKKELPEFFLQALRP